MQSCQPDGFAIKGLEHLTAHNYCLHIIDHGCSNVGVPEQLLYGPNVISIFQQMGGKGMAHGVRTGWLCDARLEPLIFDGLLED